MPTRITQIENTESETTVLKVEGTLYLKDAELLETICRDVASQTGRPVTLDLAGLSFLDSESASLLCRLKHEQGVHLKGQHLFTGKVIELAEECEKVEKYRPKADDIARVN
jgi:anti-anti-sigma regulatory factor